MDNRWNWVGPASGVLAAILFIASNALGGWRIAAVADNMRPEDPANVISAGFANNPETFQTGAHLGLLGAFFLFLFVADLRRRIAERESGQGWLSLIAFGGGVIWIGVLLYQSSIALAARVIGHQELSPEIARLLLALQWDNLDLLAPPLMAIIFAASMISVTATFLPRWFAWTGLVLAALVGLYLALPVDNPLWMAVFLAWLWVFALAAILLVQSLRRTQPAYAAVPVTSNTG